MDFLNSLCVRITHHYIFLLFMKSIATYVSSFSSYSNPIFFWTLILLVFFERRIESLRCNNIALALFLRPFHSHSRLVLTLFFGNALQTCLAPSFVVLSDIETHIFLTTTLYSSVNSFTLSVDILFRTNMSVIFCV